MEPDQELRALDHPDRATEALVRGWSASRFADASVGRQLFGLFRRAGFEVQSVDGTASGVRIDDASGQASLIEETVGAGVLTRPAADRYLAELVRRVEDGSAFSVWIAFEVAAVKPA